MTKLRVPSLSLLLFSLNSVVASEAQASVSVPLTVALTEAVVVTGTPRIAVDVGGQTRYASYSSGSGTNTLTFTLTPQIGDVDLDGIALSSPIDLNGGTMRDVSGNDATLTFTPPNTSGIKINYPSLGMDFIYDADGRYSLNGTIYNDLSSFLTAAGGTFSRTSTGTYFDSTGVMQTAGNNVPRFSYDPVTHAPMGVLIEDTQTNSAHKSSEFDDPFWVKYSMLISSNSIISPDATLSAEMLEEAVASASHAISTSTRSVTSGSTYTASVFAKAGTGNLIQLSFVNGAGYFSGLGYVNFDLSTGGVTSTGGALLGYAIEPVGNGWYRCWVSAAATLTGAGSGMVVYMNNDPSSGRSPSYAGTSKTVYLWGAQFELGRYPTSYIPTTTATLTRGADNFYLPLGGWFNASEDTAYAEYFWPYPVINNKGVYSFNNGSPTNKTDLRSNGITNTSVGGVNQESLSGGFQQGVVNRFAKGIELNNVAVSANGGTVSVDTSVSIPVVSRLDVGGLDASSSDLKLNGYLQKLRIYPRRVSNTQLQLLTQ